MQRDQLHYKLVIFDADETLRRTLIPGQPSPRAPREWELIPGVADQLRSVAWGRDGIRLGVASNQDQVAYGYLSEQMASSLLVDMIAAASGHVPPPDAIQLCPHALDVPCDCRKPQPGMLLHIMESYDVAPDDTLFVGNMPTDEEAALRAGTSFRFATDFFSSSPEQR